MTSTNAPETHASHVVVDTHDGYTFWRGADGRMFTAQTAEQFAGQRNAEMKPEHQLYRVFRLVPETSDAASLATVLDQEFPGDALAEAIEILEARWAAENREMTEVYGY